MFVSHKHAQEAQIGTGRDKPFVHFAHFRGHEMPLGLRASARVMLIGLN
jgi:hypothetical protein